MRKIRSLAERTWTKISKDGPIPEHRPDLGPCWPWLGGKITSGYGCIWSGMKEIGNLPAHRVVWELVFGPIPPGLVIDHLCHNRGCCNPSHLEPVPPRVNAIRGRGPNMLAHLERRCVHGHALTPENTAIITYRDRGAATRCRTCRRASDLRAQDRQGRAGRAIGERGGNAKLTEVKVVEILTHLSVSGGGHHEHLRLAAEYGVCAQTIREIGIGKTWKHVPRPHRSPALDSGRCTPTG